MSKFSFITKNIKLNRKFTLMRQACLLVAIAVLLIFAVFAWFSANMGDAIADGLNISIETGDNLQISLNNGTNFVSGIDLMSDDDQQYISDTNRIKGVLSMEDVTSDGKTFYRPVFEQLSGNIRTPNTSENWVNASKNRAYISQTIVFRTTSPANIYMSSGTQIITSCEDDGKSLVSDTASDIGNISDAGNFSKDCIVGALRISAVHNDELRFVCIPRTDVEFVDDDGTYSVNYGYDVTEAAFVHSYYSTNYQTEQAPVDAEDVIYSFNDSSKTYIATTVETTEEDNEYYEATATINIWLEGCDAEARRALSGGQFKINLDFTAIET